MIKYYSNKLFSMVIVLLVVTTITFFVSRLLPGDPTSLWVGEHPTKEQLKTAKKDLGFDRPIYEQYKSYMVGLLKLDLGTSVRTRQDGKMRQTILKFQKKYIHKFKIF